MTPVELSKALCFFLRHKPEAIGLKLDGVGSALLQDVIEGFAKQGTEVSLESILEAVDTDDKQRFFVSEDGLRIRAVQGHSFELSDEALVAASPPAVLYHGTVTGNLEAIFKEGLKPGSRTHVHLTDHIETAKLVGSRYRKKGEVVVLEVDTSLVGESELPFYLSLNGVWLIRSVRPEALSITVK